MVQQEDCGTGFGNKPVDTIGDKAGVFGAIFVKSDHGPSESIKDDQNDLVIDLPLDGANALEKLLYLTLASEVRGFRHNGNRELVESMMAFGVQQASHGHTCALSGNVDDQAGLHAAPEP